MLGITIKALHIMKYTEDYNQIFSLCRVTLDDQIIEALKFIRSCKKEKIYLSLRYLCLIAEYITAYNELSNLSFFAKTKHFNPNN